MATPYLLIESSGPSCSVCVADFSGDRPRVLATAEEKEPMQHTRVLLPLIKTAFAKTSFELEDCVGVAVSEGPGSYTALRAGLSSAKGICLALDVPLIQVSTLRSLAMAALQTLDASERPSRVVSVLRARRKQLYVGVYDAQGAEIEAPHTLEADDGWCEILNSAAGVLVVGPEVETVSSWFEHFPAIRSTDITALNLLDISYLKHNAGDFASLSDTVPNYLKPPHITVAKPKF